MSNQQNNVSETTTIEITSKQAAILRKLFAMAPESLEELHCGNQIMSSHGTGAATEHAPVTAIQKEQLSAAMEVHQIFYAVQSILEGKF